MKYAEFHEKKVEIYFKSKDITSNLYSPNDIKTGILKVVGKVYALHAIMLSLNGHELIWDNAYTFEEDQVDKINVYPNIP